MREVTDDVDISFGSFYGCFMHETAAAKIVPKLLNFEQKQRRLDIA